MFLFCLVFAMFCARLFICALWSPAGKGLSSWLSFVVSSVSLCLLCLCARLFICALWSPAGDIYCTYHIQSINESRSLMKLF